MTSTGDVDRNLGEATRLLREAAAAGATLIALPENFACLRPEGSPVRYKQDLDGELVRSMGEEARRLGRYLLLGSIPERVPRSRRVYNTSVLIGPQGRVLGCYRKMHLFDIDMPGGTVLKESRTVKAGERPVVVRTPLGRLGLSICYDLRFPELFRKLMAQGAEIFVVPSAFTAITGKAHWETLVRARAIENLAFVVAAAQGGYHLNGRETHGHSMIVDPWGTVLAQVPRGTGFVSVELDRDYQQTIRRTFPTIEHQRLTVN